MDEFSEPNVYLIEEDFFEDEPVIKANFKKIFNNEIYAVSIEEVQLGLRAGFQPNQIMFTPNSISFEELIMAVEFGVHVNIDNLPMLEKFGAKYGSNVPCCIRINPHILAGGNHHISVGHIDSKFGISIHQVKHIERIIKHYGIVVNGLHCFFSFYPALNGSD